MPANQLSNFDPTAFAFVADYFKVLSESSRLQILHSLQLGPMNVMELAEATGLGQANLSKHLKVLTQAGILSRRTQGTSAYYEVIDPIVFEFCQLACNRIRDRLEQQAQSFGQLRNSGTNNQLLNS